MTAPQAFSPGDSVLIRMPAGVTPGTVLSHLADDGRYSVQVGAFTMTPRADMLSPAPIGDAE